LIPETISEHVVRCVSEGLANVIQHAQATAVSVKISATDQTLHVTLQDNGQGFNPDLIPAGHYGLIGLRERARLTGGKLTIHSQPQQGTSLTFNVPLEAA
ncbi:MAG: ATP-binding protein, partial [Anaerolineales bacterium]|nr:ATP-binding protein [Anaerolineales bacterium]